MRNGTRDTSNRITDATVHVNGGCSGVLITPTLVLSAGHCVPDARRPRFPRRGLWNDLSSSIPVTFGDDRRRPSHTARAVRYNPAGLIDISLLELDRPVPPSIATPARVLTHPPDRQSLKAFLSRKTFVAAGWGVPGSSSFRQTGSLTFDAMPYDQFGTLEPARFRARGAVQLEGGDSGSPLYWISPKTGARHVVGIAQGVESRGGRYYATASPGGVEPRRKFFQPSIAAWLDREIAASALPEAPLLPLFNWWDGKAQDNYATTAPDRGYTPGEYAPSGLVLESTQEHIVNGRTQGDHRLYRLEGYLFDPHRPQPAGTVPVFGWFNAARGDHFLSSDPRYAIPVSAVTWGRGDLRVTNRTTRSGYRIHRLEGFAFDPKRPQPPGTVPLFNWWHPGREDNSVSTSPKWTVDPATITWNGNHLRDQRRQEGYSMYRLEGYIWPPVRT